MSAANSGSTAASSSHKGYKKDMGMAAVLFLLMGAILGPAVVFTPVSVLAMSGPSGILSWIIGFILIIPLGLSYTELGTMWPRAGGIAYYPAKSNGPLVGVMNGWGSFIGYSVAVPSIIVAFVEYLSYWWPALFKNGQLTTIGIILSIVIIVLFLLINTLRIKYMSAVTTVSTIVTLVGVAIIVIVLFSHFQPANFSQFHGFAPFGINGLFLAVTATVYGYGGFRQPIDYAEEVRDPGKMIPKAVIYGLIICLVIYFLESVSFVGAISWKGMGVDAGDWAKLSSLPYPFVSVAQGIVMPLLAIVAMITALNSSFRDGYIYFGGSSRVAYALSKYDRYLPQRFSTMTEQGEPIASIILISIVCALYIILLPSFSSLFPLVAGALLLSYAPGPLSLAVFRHSHPHEKRPFSLPAYKVLAPIAFVIASLMVYWSGWASVRILIPSVFIGLLFLIFYVRRGQKVTKEDVVYGIWFPIYQIVIAVLSYLGGSSFGGSNVIQAPWDSIVFVIVSIGFYYWGYYSGVKCQGNVVFDDEPEDVSGAHAAGTPGAGAQ